jgi:ATP-dependent RNA helicase SUPV3L1/SUV3
MKVARVSGGAVRSESFSRISAVLGPTNTGKTHFAIERMLAHRSGMIGLPLRLLAREVYDRIARVKGQKVAALITGEEKIVPADAKYFVCTVEAMPLDLRTAFVAVDEIQLCTDAERGHVFTDRLLNARGEEETMFLGAETMRGAIQRFVPQAHFITRPRFSDLAYTGAKKLTRLPRRSAIVAFSADDVYGLAELVRRQRGGAAVVLGALSPRTRNAQVALYQSGDVDFLVATDAIGMGINMDVDHVAFSALEKFDGIGVRPLKPEEIGQIAGRAGRHMNDGTFGVTAEAEPFDDEAVTRVEGHRYEPVRVLQYRNSSLSFRTLDTLLQGLDESPPTRGLVKARPAMDFTSLRILAAHEDVRAMATAPAAVKTLWDACQLPDFRKLSPDEHVKLVDQIYGHLMSEQGALPEDWLARQVSRLDETEGDVATLSGRLAQIRTWTYAAHRPGWVRDADHWQETTRAIEDRLSDALHERLTQRFIDRRTSVLMKRLREDDVYDIKLDESGGVELGGEAIGKLEGFRFTADPRAEGIHGRTLRAAALKGLEGEFNARSDRLANAADTDISLSDHGRLWWEGAIVGQLRAGISALRPTVQVIADEHLSPELRRRIQKRMDDWIEKRIALRLEPLIALRKAADVKAGSLVALEPEARAIAHQLGEALGSLDLTCAILPPNARAAIRGLRGFGVRFARRSIYLPKLIRPDAAALLALLWAVKHGLDHIPPPPPAGLTSFEFDDERPRGFVEAAGFRVVAGRALRLDMLDRLEEELERATRSGGTANALTPKLVSLLGCDRETLEHVLEHLNWGRVAVGGAEEATSVWRAKVQPRHEQSSRKHPKGRKPPEQRESHDSPFSKLKALMNAE